MQKVIELGKPKNPSYKLQHEDHKNWFNKEKKKKENWSPSPSLTAITIMSNGNNNKINNQALNS